MRTMRSVRSAIGLLAILAIAAPASATHGGIHPTFRTEDVWFHCEGPIKVQNVELPAPWNTTPPAGSVQDGEGCGAIDPAFLVNTPSNTMNDASFAGTFTGNIENMTVELWILAHGAATAQTNTVAAEVTLQVDGETLVDRVARAVPLEESETSASRVARFTIPDLGCTREVFDAEGELVDVITGGLATEDGDGATEHEINLGVGTGGAVAVVRAEIIGWVWDTTEVPSGITFNDETPAATTVPPGAPANCG